MHPVALAALLPVLALAQSGQTATTVQSRSGPVRVERLASLEFPWGLAYLPDGRLLITEKPGRLRVFDNGRLSEPIAHVPQVFYRGGVAGEQGGLLDVAVDPRFESNQRIYLSYSEATPDRQTGNVDTKEMRFGKPLDPSDNVISGGAVARAVLNGNRLDDVQVIWRQDPKTVGRGHFGNRLIFATDGSLFITSAERMRFDPAQDPSSNLGKVVRINTDGSAPKDNPFATRERARPEIWSLGHRNMLAAAIHPQTSQLWVWEMGPLGGDELNIIQPGKNYGWPIVSNGDNYDRSPIPDHPTHPEFEAPVRTWTPVISPSGAAFYRGSLFPWRDNALVGSLSAKALVRMTLEDTRVVDEERIQLGQRIRDVIEAGDGSVLVVTDDRNGALLRLRPAARGDAD
jgi:glucose/arabinose dehydrogenase